MQAQRKSCTGPAPDHLVANPAEEVGTSRSPALADGEARSVAYQRFLVALRRVTAAEAEAGGFACGCQVAVLDQPQLRQVHDLVQDGRFQRSARGCECIGIDVHRVTEEPP